MKIGVIAVAVLAAVLDHQVVDALASAGIFHSAHDEYRHVALLPAFAGASAVVALLVTMFRHDARRVAGPQADWLVVLAQRLRAIPTIRLFTIVLLAQMAVLFIMESAEQLFCNGHLAEPYAWLGASLPVATAIALFVAAMATAVILAGCDVIRRAVRLVAETLRAVLVVSLRVRPQMAVRRVRTSRRRQRADAGSLLAFSSGLRAPPIA